MCVIARTVSICSHMQQQFVTSVAELTALFSAESWIKKRGDNLDVDTVVLDVHVSTRFVAPPNDLWKKLSPVSAL